MPTRAEKNKNTAVLGQASEPVIVILAGGQGKRLNLGEPKQFFKFPGAERSMLQRTYDRVRALTARQRIFVVTLDRFRATVHSQLPEIPQENIIGQPEDKNTAPAICLTSLVCEKRFVDPTMIVIPCDHIIYPEYKFRKCMALASDYLEYHAVLYCFGIEPDEPSPCYGYIEKGARVLTLGIPEFEVESFKEKPDTDTAKKFVESGKYLWNSGIYAWKTSLILDEFNYLQRNMLDCIRRGLEGEITMDKAYARIEGISVDHAIMEKTVDAMVLLCDFGWMDIGDKNSWEKSIKEGLIKKGG